MKKEANKRIIGYSPFYDLTRFLQETDGRSNARDSQETEPKAKDDWKNPTVDVTNIKLNITGFCGKCATRGGSGHAFLFSWTRESGENPGHVERGIFP